MFKYIRFICFILILLCFGCSKGKIQEENNLKKEEYTDDYVEIIPNSALKYIENLDNEVLMDYNEIIKYNDNIKQKSKSLYDLNINNITKDEILNYINSYKIPTLPKYNNSEIITNNQIKEILENRNIDNINENKLVKGIIVNRTNLKSFPTDINFFSNKKLNNFDAIQETELQVNTPVLILHESKDKNWKLVMSPIYIGWVKNNDIGITTEDEYNYFINNKDFIVITEPFIEINDTLLDMGVKLPLITSKKNKYKVSIPVKNEDGVVERKEIEIEKNKAHIGYLPYTKRNIYIQSFKYENTPYSWGGMDYGIDCSSFIANIYKTFGFIFPRNVSEQAKSIGETISIENKNELEKLNILTSDTDYPFLLYKSSHVMIYLGVKNNMHYIIHASGNINELKVIESELENSNHIKNINKIVKIKI